MTGDQRESLVTLTRGLSILDLLAAAATPRGLSHAVLARQLKLRRSTLYRYLACLQDLGFIEPTEENHSYRLGPKVLVLAAAAQQQRAFLRFAKRFVNELAAETGDTAHAAIYDHGHAVTVELADGAGPIGPRIRIGSRRPAHTSASGKVFLAYGSHDEIARYVTGGLERRTERTIVHEDELRDHLADVRGQGYATDVCEYAEGICCVAVPVFDFRREVTGSLSISIASSGRDTRRLRVLGRTLQRVAADFSKELGAAADHGQD